MTEPPVGYPESRHGGPTFGEFPQAPVPPPPMLSWAAVPPGNPPGNPAAAVPPGWSAYPADPAFRGGPLPGSAAFGRRTRRNSILTTVLALTVALLGALNLVWGFLPVGQLTSTRGTSLSLGSVFFAAGWIPALLILSGVLAPLTLVRSVSRATAWAVSAAAAAAGGVGALGYLLSRGGTDAGVGALARNTSQQVGLDVQETASAGLVLLVILGLLQMLVAVGGLAAALVGGRGRPGLRMPAEYSDGSPPGPAFEGRDAFPAPPPGYGLQRPAETPPPGPPPFRPPPGERIRPMDSHDRRTPPPVQDPHSSLSVHTGLVPPDERPTPRQAPSAQPVPATPTDPSRADAAPPAPGSASYYDGLPPTEQEPVYARVDYGSADYVWEPTYSEAPDYEKRAAQEADESRHEVEAGAAFLYETPEWERPQFEPPHLDSGRHSGWDAGFGDDARRSSDGGEHASGPEHWRSIPRAE